MDLSIIIVSWNVRDLLARLLDSIFQYTEGLNYEVIIVDNDSKDGTAENIKKNYGQWIEKKQLKIITNDFNAGFAKANNQGARASIGKYQLYMNPDMEIMENSFLKLYEFMEKTPNVGICTCRLLFGDKTTQPNVKKDPGFCDQLLILLKLHHIFSFLPPLERYLQKNFDYNQKKYVHQVMGAFIFTRATLMNEINGWDEDYPLWWEDLQLCLDVRKTGAEIVYLPITQVIHYEGKSFAQVKSLKKQKRFNKGMLTYFKKNKSRATYWFLLIMQPISYLLTLFAQIFRIKPKSQSKIK